MGEDSGRGKKTKTNHEISRFASLHTGKASVILLVFSAFVVLVSSPLFLLIVVVAPFTSPFLSRPCFSSSSLSHSPDSPVVDVVPCCWMGPSRLLPSPDPPSSEKNRPTSHGLGFPFRSCWTVVVVAGDPIQRAEFRPDFAW